MSDRPSLQSQIDAVESAVLSRESWMERRADFLRRKGLDEDYGLRCTRMDQPALKAALETLKGLAERGGR